MKTNYNFHNKNFALSLAFIMRFKATQKMAYGRKGYNLIIHVVGKHGNNIFASDKIGFYYHSFWFLNFLGAAMFYFMTSYGCSIVSHKRTSAQ